MIFLFPRIQQVCNLSHGFNVFLINNIDFWDVKFYPYLDLNEVPIFAVINSQKVSEILLEGSKDINCYKILICRAPVDKQMQILRSISDDEVRDPSSILQIGYH